MKYELIMIAIMALTTYVIRMIPLTFYRKEIKSIYVQSFLYYIPYAVLASLTFPYILYACDSMVAAGVTTLILMVLSYKGLKLFEVAMIGIVLVYILQLIIF